MAKAHVGRATKSLLLDIKCNLVLFDSPKKRKRCSKSLKLLGRA